METLAKLGGFWVLRREGGVAALIAKYVPELRMKEEDAQRAAQMVEEVQSRTGNEEREKEECRKARN